MKRASARRGADMACGQKIKTFLWFDTEAEEAAKLYTSIFKNSSSRGRSSWR